jgi:hypothetical protein
MSERRVGDSFLPAVGVVADLTLSPAIYLTDRVLLPRCSARPRLSKVARDQRSDKHATRGRRLTRRPRPAMDATMRQKSLAKRLVGLTAWMIITTVALAFLLRWRENSNAEKKSESSRAGAE